MASSGVAGGVQCTPSRPHSVLYRPVNGATRGVEGGYTRTHHASKTTPTSIPFPQPVGGMRQGVGVAATRVDSPDTRPAAASTPQTGTTGAIAVSLLQQPVATGPGIRGATDRYAVTTRNRNTQQQEGGVRGAGYNGLNVPTGHGLDVKGTPLTDVTSNGGHVTASSYRQHLYSHRTQDRPIVRPYQDPYSHREPVQPIVKPLPDPYSHRAPVQYIVRSLQGSGSASQHVDSGVFPQERVVYVSRDLHNNNNTELVSRRQDGTRVPETDLTASIKNNHTLYQPASSQTPPSNQIRPSSSLDSTRTPRSTTDQQRVGTHRTVITIGSNNNTPNSPAKHNPGDDVTIPGSRVNVTWYKTEGRSEPGCQGTGVRMETCDVSSTHRTMSHVTGRSKARGRQSVIDVFPARVPDSTSEEVKHTAVPSAQSDVTPRQDKYPDPATRSAVGVSTQHAGLNTGGEGSIGHQPAPQSVSDNHQHTSHSVGDRHEYTSHSASDGHEPTSHSEDGSDPASVKFYISPQTTDSAVPQTDLESDSEQTLREFDSVIDKLSHSSSAHNLEETGGEREMDTDTQHPGHSSVISQTSTPSRSQASASSVSVEQSAKQQQQQQQQQTGNEENTSPMPPPRKGRASPSTPHQQPPVSSETGVDVAARHRRPLSSPPATHLQLLTTTTTTTPTPDDIQQEQSLPKNSKPAVPEKPSPKKEQTQIPDNSQVQQVQEQTHVQQKPQQQQQQQPQQQQQQPQQQPQQEDVQRRVEARQLLCVNHPDRDPHRYCSDHNQCVCMECAFEFHRTCSDVDLLGNASRARRGELEGLCELLLFRKAEWECALTELQKSKTRLSEERERTLSAIQHVTDRAVKMIQERGAALTQEAETLFHTQGAESATREERLRHAVGVSQQIYRQGEEVLGERGEAGEAALLQDFGKLKNRFEEILDKELTQSADVLELVRVTSEWPDDVSNVKLARLTVERKPIVTKNPQLSERGLQTFRQISKRKRRMIASDTYQEKLLPLAPVIRSGPRSSMSRSIASTGSLGSFSMSNQSMGFLDGPQSLFEFWAGLEMDNFPFGLGDICVMQPRATILITYLTSDILRVFPWRQESPPFVSEPLGCTLCCITQLTTEIVAVTSSNSDKLSFLKLEKDSIHLMHAVPMKKQYRAVTSIDFRTLALATDNKKYHNNVINIVRFDSSDFVSYIHLKTINGRVGSFPRIRLLSKTLFKVPYSMCVSTHGHIIVSDSENRALLALGQNGEQRFIFQPPKLSRVIDTPGGVACSPSGFLYLVDSCEQRILRFNPRGRFLKVVLSQEDGLEWPIAVACVDDSTLCVAEFYGQVKVFQVR